MKFGIFTVSIPEYDPEKALEVAAEIGYDGLEWRVIKDDGDRSKPSFWSGNRTSMTAEELLAGYRWFRSRFHAFPSLFRRMAVSRANPAYTLLLNLGYRWSL